MANNNKHTGPNVPALRFPEFSGEWESCTLGDITNNFSRRNKDRIQYPMFSVTNNRGFVPQSEQFEDREMFGEDIQAYKVIEKGDFAYNPARINVGSIAKYEGNGKCMISSLYVCFNTIDRIDRDWFMHLLKTPKMNFYYNLNGEGGVRVYLFYPNFARIRSSYPSLAEQKKIAAMLSLIDERIATQSKIIEEQETLLKSLADKLISAQSANVAICGCVDAKASTMKEGELESHGAFPVFGASGLCGYSNEALEESDSILVTKDGSGVGTCQYATGAHSFLGTLCSLTAKEGVYLPYVYYALLNFNFASFKTGLAIPHIYFKDYGKAVIYCPSYDEQVRIASGLEKIEAKIKSDKELLKQYQLQKEYLLSRMFI